MNVNPSFVHYFFTASPIVKMVMLILLSASIYSWVLIFQRVFFLRWTRINLSSFEDRFWSSRDLTKLYQELSKDDEVDGVETIFIAGFKEFARLQKKSGIKPDAVIEGVKRAMQVAEARLTERLENHLSFLATVGSTSPYVGLFGTVWGIMTAFQSLGQVEQATIAMVAPGISEALVATAMGLFAAIPAVIAFNRFSNNVDTLVVRYGTFQEEFINYLHRQLH